MNKDAEDEIDGQGRRTNAEMEKKREPFSQSLKGANLVRFHFALD